MSLAGAASSILRLLERRFAALPDAENPALNWSFRVLSPAQLDESLSDHLTLLAYRVDLDPTKRRGPVAPAGPGLPPRTALSLELKLLLSVWGQDGRRELQVMGKALDFLDLHPVLVADDLDPAYAWSPGAQLSVNIDTLSTQDLVQLWDALSPSFRLSIPLVIRGIRLSPDSPGLVPLVNIARVGLP